MTAKKDYSSLGIIYAIYTVLSIILQVGISIIASFVPFIYNSYDIHTIFSMVSIHIIGFIFLYFTIAKKNKNLQPIEKVKIQPKRFAQLFFISYFFMILGNIIGLIFTAFIGNVKGDGVDNILIDTVSQLSPLTSFFLVVILAPVVEEYFFRKFIIDKVHMHGKLPAIFISGMMFGLFHMNANQFFYAFFLGIILAYVYVNYGDIKSCVLLHMLVNSVGFIASILAFDIDMDTLNNISSLDPTDPASAELILQASSSVLPLLFFEILIFGFIIAGFIFLIKNIKTFKAFISYAKSTQEITTSNAFFNIGILSFTIVCTVIIIMQLFS